MKLIWEELIRGCIRGRKLLGYWKDTWENLRICMMDLIEMIDMGEEIIMISIIINLSKDKCKLEALILGGYRKIILSNSIKESRIPNNRGIIKGTITNNKGKDITTIIIRGITTTIIIIKVIITIIIIIGSIIREEVPIIN